MSNIQNENTLFRFVSLRSPDLLTPTGIVRRFVMHPTLTGAAFFTPMASKPASQSKWQNLQQSASSFSAYSTEGDIKTTVGNDFYSVAAWLTANRTNFDNDEMLSRISSLIVLSDAVEARLWDNLFYQVVTQNVFYVKEAVMQALVLNNLIKQTATFSTDEEKKQNLFSLANARVVLPTELYEEGKVLKEGIVPPNPINPKSDNNLAVKNANEKLEILLKAKKELKTLQKKFQKSHDANFDKAKEAYLLTHKTVIETYNATWKSQSYDVCANPLPGAENGPNFCSQPNIDLPDLPAFTFDHTQPITLLASDLSGESYTGIQDLVDEQKPETYDEVIQMVDESINEQHSIIAANTDFTEPVLFLGGIKIPAFEIPKPLATGPTKSTFIPEQFGIKRLGIADYKKVVSHVCCYAAGEVAAIENIMARELRSKTTTRERIEETTETTETSQETEHLTDTTTTERFQMQTEMAKIMQQQKQFTANTSFHAGWGIGGSDFSLDASAGYSSATSKEESNRQAVTQSKDLTQRAMERVVSKIRTELIKKTTESFKEENIHEFDNRTGNNHVSGVFRFINAIYKNQIYNYGKRLMFEFTIPQPSKMHRLGMLQSTNSVATTTLHKPIDPRTIGYGDLTKILTSNYSQLAATYGADDIEPPPAAIIFLDFSFSKEGINPSGHAGSTQAGGGGFAMHSSDFAIPEGYEVEEAHGAYSGREMGVPNQAPRVSLIIGGRDGFDALNFYNQQWATAGNKINAWFYSQKIRNKLTISVSTWDEFAFTVNIVAKCTCSDDAMLAWQAKAFKAILDGYNKQLQDFNADNDTITQTSLGTNPGFYRDIEQLVLRKNCVSYLVGENQLGLGFYSGTDLGSYTISPTIGLDNYGSLAKFIEQGFEWDIMSYNFYPYYWGNRAEWPDLYQYDCDDPLFRSFMQSGMARVIVTVKPGFEDAMMLYLGTGQIWNGGQIPIIGDPLYLSIVDELKEQEYVVEETWDTVVPTSLVALQSSGVAIAGSGLPCGEECNDHADGQIQGNKSLLGIHDDNQTGGIITPLGTVSGVGGKID